ncbi:MAG: GTP-binding protein [Promethearchaeota archaeon]
MLINEINIKLVVFGQGGVGKTSLISAFLENEVQESYIPTIGNNISRKEYLIDDIAIRLNIWDIGGQRSFNPLNPVCFTNIDASLLVFDLSQPIETIKELEFYLSKLKESNEESIVFIIGNKLDLIKENELKTIVEHQKQLELPLILTSALKNINVREVFELIIFTFLNDWENKFPSEKFQGISKKFLDKIGKSENELKELFVNPNELDKIKIKRAIEPHIVKKVVKEKKGATSTGKIIDAALILQQKIRKIDSAKQEIVNTFNKNLEEVQKLVLNLKETPIKDLEKNIDLTIAQLKEMMEDFEYNLESLLKMEDNIKNKENKEIKGVQLKEVD